MVKDKAVVKDKAAAVVVQDKVKAADEAWGAEAAALAPVANASVPVAARLRHISRVYLALR